MGATWFTEFSDELARCLVDARNCAELCEAHLAADAGAVDALAAPAAVARVLIDLIDQPPQIVLGAVRLCRELAATAADEPGLPPDLTDALCTLAASTGALLEAAG
jgi:hypothetical protein